MRILFLAFAFFFIISPQFAMAQQDIRDLQAVQDIPDELVPCGDEGQSSCQACHFYQLVENIFAWVFGIILVVAAIVVAIGGGRLIFSGGNQMAKRDARKIIRTALISVVLVGSAWIIVDIMIATLYGQADASSIWSSIQCIAQPIPSAP